MTFLHSFSNTRSWRMRWLIFAALALIFLLLAGCEQTGQMYDQPRLNPLQASDLFPDQQSARQPVPGTVPFASTGSPNDPALTGQGEDGQAYKGWPVPVNKALVQSGQEQFNIFCVPCHGPNGEGNGKAVGFGFPKPPDLLSGNATTLSNGDIFQVIQNGKGKMFSYGYRVKAPERWAIVAYIRAMQAQKGSVDPQSLTPDQINQIGKQQ